MKNKYLISLFCCIHIFSGCTWFGASENGTEEEFDGFSEKYFYEKKYIFTNGSHDHVKNITKQLGIDGLFDGAFDITDAEYKPKPEPMAFDLMTRKFDLNPSETIYVEDIAKNLSIGKKRGCTTVWLINDEHFGKMDSDKEYISHKIENLSLFLKEIRLLKSQ